MGTEKEERHGHDHDHHHRREEPASTDMADIIKAENAAKAASARQRKHLKGAEKEFGQGAKSDIHTRVVRFEVKCDHSEIMFGAGKEQGIRTDMEGYLQVGDGLLAEFKVSWCDESTALASVHLTQAQVSESTGAVINPSSKPAPGQDLHGRIIANSIAGDYVEITIGLGAVNGVRTGMKGYMHPEGSETAYADFTIGEIRGRTCKAYVRLHNLDEVHRNMYVTVNPASAKPKADKKH